MDKKELIKHTFKLNDREAETFMLLWTNKEPVSVEYIAKHSKRDRTTIQKAINKLKRKRIIQYRQINLVRGFMFKYTIKDTDKILKILNSSRETIKQGVDKGYCELFDEVKK